MIRLHVDPAEGQPFDHDFDGDCLVIGRAASADLVVLDRLVSRHHAKLTREADGLFIEDLASRNGTLVNGVPIQKPVLLHAGDVIRISASTLVVKECETGETAVSIGEDPTATSGTGGTLYVPAAELLESHDRVDTSTIGEKETLQHHAERAKLLNDVHAALARSISQAELLELILDRVFDHLRPDQGVIVLSGEKELYTAARRSLPGVESENLLSSTLVSEVVEKGHAALVLDAQTDRRFADAASIMESGVRSIVAAPLLDPDEQEILGMIVLSSRVSHRMFSEEDVELLVSLAAVAALRIRNLALAEEAAERRRIAEQLALARRIQLSLLPSTIPDIPGYDLHGSNAPSQEVSGDYYQILERNDGRECVLMVADVSGKGIAASLLTTALEALCAGPIQDGLSPGEICSRIGALLHERTPPEQFATSFLAVLDNASGALRYASAGHNPALLVRRSGEVEELGRTGLPLGLLSDSVYETRETALEPGDTLVIYTDGLTEAINRSDEEFGSQRLAEVCRNHVSSSVETLTAGIEEELERFTQGVPYGDDRTLVLARRCE